jgi:hypothetical protein
MILGNDCPCPQYVCFLEEAEGCQVRRLGMSEIEEPEVDPIEVEMGLIQELIGENIVIVLHQNGMTIMMDEGIEYRSDEQLKMFSRLYVAANPSFVLRLFLIMEVWLLLVWETLEDFYNSRFNKP